MGVRTGDQGSVRGLLWAQSGFWEGLATTLMLAADGESRPARLESMATDPGASPANSPGSIERREGGHLSACPVSA